MHVVQRSVAMKDGTTGVTTMTISIALSGMLGHSPPVDIISAMMTVWRIRGKLIRTVLCCAVHNETHPRIYV